MDTICLRLNEETPQPCRLVGSGTFSVCRRIVIPAVGVIVMLSIMLAAGASDSIAYSVSPPQVPVLKNTKTAIETSINTEHRQEFFDNYIRKKYPGGMITDLAKGVKRIKVVRYFSSRPVKLNIIETDFYVNPDLAVVPALAGETLNKKAKISYINKKDNAIVSVNGGYFKQQTGAPLGLLMIDGRIYSGAMYNRVAMGIFDNKFEMARAGLNITLHTNKNNLKIDNINQPRTLASHILVYDSLWGKYAPAPPKGGISVIVSGKDIVGTSYSSVAIPENGYVISAPKSKLTPITNDKRLKLEINTTPEWKGVKHIISGGPYLIKDGEIYVDATAQKLNSIAGRNPRTAIGYTSDNNIIIVTADGRESSSVGLTLMELARYMKQIGCVNAMNLDGGSSTVMYGAGGILNSPSYKGGVEISNAVHIVME